jgi:hypothetical protein
MARTARPVPVPYATSIYTACRCKHLKFRWLDERVIQQIGERDDSFTAERFRRMYQVSPCKGWPLYRAVAHDMGIPIPGGVFDDSSSEEESEEEGGDENEEEEVESEDESQDESQDEERPLPRVPVPPLPRTHDSLTGSARRAFPDFVASGVKGHAAFAAFIASGASGSTGNGALAAFLASGAFAALLASGTSNKRTTATAATDSSKKHKTGAEKKGLDNRPAWMVQMERVERSSSFDKADSMSWGKQPKSTASRSNPIMSWGKPQTFKSSNR